MKEEGKLRLPVVGEEQARRNDSGELVPRLPRVRLAGAHDNFLQTLVHRRNLNRQTRFDAEKVVLRPLPTMPLAPCKEVWVSRFSTIAIDSIMRD